MLFVRLALRSLLRNRRRSALTLAAVLVGTAVVVFAHGFGEGLVRMLVDGAIEKRIGALQVHAKGYLEASEAAPLTLDQDAALVDVVAAVPGVVAATPRVRFAGVLSAGRRSSMVLAEGVDPVRERAVCPERAGEVPSSTGAFVDESAPDGIVISKELASALEVEVGDALVLQASGKGGQLNALDVVVRGVTAGAGLLESKRVITVPLSLARELTTMEGRATEIAVSVKDVERLDPIIIALRAALPETSSVSTWAEVSPFLKDATLRLRVILGGISLVLFTIVVFGVVNTMLMSVYERVREIGTMMAVGTRRRQVLALFLWEAIVIGLVGAVAGALIGLALTALAGNAGISFGAPGTDVVQIVRPVPRLDVAALALVGSAVGAVLAALYPALRASSLHPAVALRR